MRKQFLCLILIALGFVCQGFGQQGPPAAPAYPYTHAYLASINDTTQYPCAYNSPTATVGLNNALLAVPATGGNVDATCFLGPQTLTADVFSPITKYITLFIGTAITVNANATINNNFEICYGPGGSLSAGAGFTLTNNAQPCGHGTTTTGGGTCSGIVQAGEICAGPPPLDGERSASWVQQNSNSVTNVPPAGTIPANTTITVPFLQSVTQNDQVLVIVVNGFFPTSGDTFTVTDTQGNTFSQVGSQIAGYQLSYAFVATAKTTSADTVSVVNSTGQDLFIGVLATEYQNLGAFESAASNEGQPSTGPGYMVSSVTTTNALDTIAGAISAESVSLSLQLQMVSAGWNVLSPTQSVSIAGVGAYSLQSINAFAPTVGTYSTNVFSNYLTGINAQQSAFFYVFKPLTTNFLTGPMLPRFLPPTGLLPSSNFAGLGTPADGMVVYCLDCDAPTSPEATCTSSGAKAGAEAHRIDGTWQCVNGPGSGTVSVTSVGLALPSIFTVSGSPITGAGTLTGTLANEAADSIWGNFTGSSAPPTFGGGLSACGDSTHALGYASHAFTCQALSGGGGGNPLTAIGQVYVGGTSGAATAAAAGLTGQLFASTDLAIPSFISPGILEGNGQANVTTTPYTLQCDSSTAVLDRATTVIGASGASVFVLPDPTDSGCGVGIPFIIENNSAGTLTVNRETSATTFEILNGSSTTHGASSFTLTNGQSAKVNAISASVYNIVTSVSGGGSASGPTYNFVSPVLSNFSWFNQGSSTADVTNGFLAITTDTTSATWRMLVESSPGAASTCILAIPFLNMATLVDNYRFGMVISDGTKIISFSVGTNGSTFPQILIINWDSPTTYDGVLVQQNILGALGGFIWLKVVDDGTTYRTYYASIDGTHYSQLYQQSRTTLLTTTEYGFGVQITSGSTPVVVSAASFALTTP